LETTAGEQRRRPRRKSTASPVVRLELKDGLGNARWITSDLISISDSGIGILLVTPLAPGSTVGVRGKLGKDGAEASLRAGVRWCAETTKGSFCAGLEFLEGGSDYVNDGPAAISSDPSEVDYYEVLQLSPNADAETINRVYRLLAQRYHPDNSQTGNAELFKQLSEAYQVLSDPEKRASYDARHRVMRRLQWKIFDQGSVATGQEAEKRKRQGVIGLLYAKALNDPDDCAISIQAFEDLLGCPREHLKATLWYLRGKGLITRSDSGRYSITVEGFEEVEKRDFMPLTPVSRQLPARSREN
jgi:curved DNA-binding protein